MKLFAFGAAVLGAFAPSGVLAEDALDRFPIHGYGGYVVIANRGEGTVSFVDPDSLEVVQNVDIDGEPMYFAYNHDMAEVWVADRANDRLVILDLTGGFINEYLDDDEYGYDYRNGDVSRRKLPINGITVSSMSIPVSSGPFHAMINQDPDAERQFALVTCDVDNVVDVIDISTKTKIASIPVPDSLAGLDVSPHDVTMSGRWAYISYVGATDGKGYVASVRDDGYGDFQHKEVVQLENDDPHVAIRTGRAPFIAASGGGSDVGHVLKLTRRMRTVKCDTEESSPHGMIIDYDNDHLYITNIADGGANAVVTYSVGRGVRQDCPEITTTNAIPHNPAVNLDRTRLFITHSGSSSTANSAFDLDEDGCPVPGTEEIFNTGANPFGIFVLPPAKEMEFLLFR